MAYRLNHGRLNEDAPRENRFAEPLATLPAWHGCSPAEPIHRVVYCTSCNHREVCPMKLKCRPKDFQVREITERRPNEGAFALYRLRKWSLDTLEALHQIAQTCSVGPEQVHTGGMKDRHALTEQYLTIEGGPARSLRGRNWQLAYLGQTDRPFGPKDIAANRFWIVVRRLTRRQAEAAKEELPLVVEEGVPNYFDRQRFGSLGRSGRFVAAPWCRGHYEQALWLALADEGFHDRPQRREEKRFLREHWGQWSVCLPQMSSRHARRAIRHLAQHPGDFRRALARIDVRLRRLYLAAYQSFLWNRMLAEWLRRRCPARALHEVSLGTDRVPLYRSLPSRIVAQLAETALPLPSARLHIEPGPMQQFIEEVLAAEGVQLRDLRVKYPRDSFFSTGTRPALFRPKQATAAVHKDDLYPQRRKLILQFELPPGCYATLVVKRLVALPTRSGR